MSKFVTKVCFSRLYCCVTKMLTSTQMIGQVFDAMFVASTDKEWLEI